MTITPLYVSFLALMFVALSVRVIAARRSAAVGLGDGGNRALLRRVRAHANFAEYVPLAVILMALLELQNAPAWIVHLLGVTLICGRAIHAYGVGRDPERLRFRVIGMALTFTVLVLGALATLGMAVLERMDLI